MKRSFDRLPIDYLRHEDEKPSNFVLMALWSISGLVPMTDRVPERDHGILMCRMTSC